MGDQHKGGAPGAGQFQHQGKDVVGRAAVEIAGGFIGQHAGRLRDQGAGNRHALALATRELRRFVRGALAQADGGQDGIGLTECLRPLHAADEQGHGDVFLGGKFGQQVVELVHKAQVLVAPLALFARVHAVQIAPQLHHLAGTGRVQAAQQVQQRAFARAAGTDDGQRLARMHLDVHTLQHLHLHRAVVKAFGQALGGQNDGVCFVIHSARPPQGSHGWRASWGRGWRQRPAAGRSAQSARCRWPAARWACG